MGAKSLVHAKVRCSRGRYFTSPVQLYLRLAVLLSCLLAPARGRPSAGCCGSMCGVRAAVLGGSLTFVLTAKKVGTRVFHRAPC